MKCTLDKTICWIVKSDMCFILKVAYCFLATLHSSWVFKSLILVLHACGCPNRYLLTCLIYIYIYFHSYS